MGFCALVGFARSEHLQNLSGSLCCSSPACHRTDTRNAQRRILTILNGLLVDVRRNASLTAHCSARPRSKLLHMAHGFGRMGNSYSQGTTCWSIILVLTAVYVVRYWRRICKVSQARINVLGWAGGRIKHNLVLMTSVKILTLKRGRLVCVKFG